ncbi:succinate dehydrogenase cytochrome b subunit [Membranicola marinus]|uniref:Succinate dehydrogenase cytochrome b subunit n=1 Tax=Membranihabitans marinus TaxID=1227546 RepID=A0A953HQH0_9BACT|nr:succinate dehydrogenase cytochrome b subunit [Membranihabitans marinus]MBY5956530.1 succinate dehydrogenase cytochrome b subunit [Membranihabitans marinus]
MNWLSRFFTSSIGRKLIMSLTGLFLILFLVVHLVGNLQLLNEDDGFSFNTYAYFMTHNGLVKTISFGLYFFIVLHAIQGIVVTIHNRKSRKKNYRQLNFREADFASRNMAVLGLLILAFLFMHMGDFWLKMKMGQLDMVKYDGVNYPVNDLYTRVNTAFSVWWIVVLYVIGQIALFFHLKHGFYSAFQTLGWNHPKYTPIIKGIGLVFSVVVPLGFALIPLYIYFVR